MLTYLMRRLLLLPITLFFIILVNFIIINLAPGDPTTITEISPEGGATRQEGHVIAFGGDDRYLQFREHYGLTLPILFNSWPWMTQKTVEKELSALLEHKNHESVKELNERRILLGDQSRFIMPQLLKIINDPNQKPTMRSLASRFFIRGGTKQGHVGTRLTQEEKKENRKIAADNDLLQTLAIEPNETQEGIEKKMKQINEWYRNNKVAYQFEPSDLEKVAMFFFDTRFFRYFSRVLTLDFGTLRNDQNKTVIYEVVRRFKYSLTLAVIPMVVTFVLCQIFGFIMAYQQDRWPDYFFNVTFLILYAIPVFVVAPFLIEKVGLNGTFPFTSIPIPISGFTSPEAIYNQMTSLQRLNDVLRHIFLPLIAIIYGSLAAQSRLSRTAVLEVMRQDYVRTAHAKGVAPFTILYKHIGRNAAITIVTSIAGSLGVILGGSLIVETLFDINGFGKFFYDAVINRDYNVIMFSTLAGAFLSLLGYLVADIAYTVLDPRISLE